MNTTTRTTLAAAALLTLAAPAAPAFANDADVVRTGSCSANADWKLKASPENGKIEVEGEVDSNVNGQDWNWRLLHNGTLSAKGTKTTVAPSGSFEVERLFVDLSGTDKIVFKATNPKSGETCRGVVNY